MDSPARPDEEEARRRRSTDCIYFLASPLTCKKGGECEYRHSDAARMNPRDCWYWFNGNCANPKCSFRHPPLDNLTGAPTTPRPAQQSVPQAQVSVPSQAHGAIPAKQKQGVPCYYFQKGMCTKGDRCAFLHVPQSAGNPALQPAKVFNPVLHPNPPLNNSNSWTKPNTSSQQNTPAVGIVDKPNSSAHDGKPVQQKEKLMSSADRPSRIYQNHSNSYAQTGLPKRYQPQPSVQGDLTDNGMEAGEFVSEPSAGSGVIVGGADDDVKQSFKGNHSTYHHRANGTAMLRQTHGGYEPERSYKSSAERSSSEKRISQRERIPAVAASSLDLRNRLLKQRKLNNNSRSTEAPVQNGTHPEDEHSDQHKRGEHQDGLSRSRLRDRIRLPGETSFDRLGSHSEEWDRGSRTRLSPPKPSDLRRRLHERLKARSAEEIPGNSAKGLVVKASSSEDAESLNFAGPKSLAELKAKKGVGMSGEDAIVRSLGSSRMTSEIVSSREAAPFEGPKPLSAILKRKREAAFANPAAQSGIIQEADNDAVAVEEEFQPIANDTVWENMEGTGEEEEEEAFHPENDVAYEDNNDEAAGAQELEEHQDPEAAAEDYDDEAAAAQEQEEHQDAEVAAEDYDYEAADINDEEENDYQEYHDNDDNEDLDDDDDDFARKVSVMIS